MIAGKITRAIFASALTWSAACAGVCAASGPAKNKEGNKLYQQGKYQDAEKAYIDAQQEMPGRPELLYNLGNALVKQKKYEPAVQSLRQAVAKADRGLQASSWYNLGNALYESGNLRDATQSYIQALRINPADREAKHNLELALRQMKEQKQSASGGNSKDDKQQKEEGKKDSQASSSGQQDKKNDQKKDAEGRQDKQREQLQQQSADERRDGSMSKDRAFQILDAMKDQELAEQRKLQERQARRKATGRDW